MKRRRSGKKRAVISLLLALFSVVGCVLLSVFRAAFGAPPSIWFLLEGLGALAFTLLPAWLGRIWMGEGRLSFSVPDAGTLLSDLICGGLFLAPASLMRDVSLRVTGPLGIAPQPPVTLFAPILLFCALILPCCHALFYGRFLTEGMRGLGLWGRILPPLLYALSGGCPADFFSRLCMGLMLSAIARRQAACLSAAAVEGAFLCAWLLLSSLGLGRFLSGSGFGAILIRAVGCFAWYFAFRHAFAAKPAERRADLAFIDELTGREWARIAVALVLMALATLMGVLQ